METNLERLSKEIRDAVGKLDHDLTHTLSEQLLEILNTHRLDSSAEKPVVRVLQALRRKRFFAPMGEIAKIYLDQITGESAKVQLQLVQALIDQGILMEANDELEFLAEDHAIDTWAGSEARGLIGRVHKQAYVNARQRAGPSRRSLSKAVRAYYEVYLKNKDAYWWHGINAVACLARGERDGIEASAFFGEGETAGSAAFNRDSCKNGVHGGSWF